MPISLASTEQSNNTYSWWGYRGKGHFNIMLVEMCFNIAFLESNLAISIKLKISFGLDIPLWEAVPEKQTQP